MPLDKEKSHLDKLKELVKNNHLTEFAEEYKYSDKLNEIAKKFRFSDNVLASDNEIDDRHIIDDLSIKQIRDDDYDKDDNVTKIDM